MLPFPTHREGTPVLPWRQAPWLTGIHWDEYLPCTAEYTFSSPAFLVGEDRVLGRPVGLGISRTGFRFGLQHWWSSGTWEVLLKLWVPPSEKCILLALSPHPASSFCSPNDAAMATTVWDCYWGTVQSLQNSLWTQRVFSFGVCFCVLVVSCRHFKKDEAVWYFSGQLCKTFISVRRLKNHRDYFFSEDETSFMNWSLYLNIESVGNLLQLVKNSRRGTKNCVKTCCVSGLDCVLRKLVFTWLLLGAAPALTVRVIRSGVVSMGSVSQNCAQSLPTPISKGLPGADSSIP